MRNQRQSYNSNGRTRRKGGPDNGESSSCSANENKNKYKGLGDPFNNGEIPLCRLLNDAIEDIFPELQDRGSSNNGIHSQQPQAESGSTLGQMIRRRYLLSRKPFRTSLYAKNNQGERIEGAAFEHKNNIDFPNNTINDTSTPPTSTTVAKKKRKRKKKKRQESAASFPPTIITNEKNENAVETAIELSSRNGTGSHLNDGKSMMSTADHSLEALDEAVKNEVEKLIELEANHEIPFLESLPSDDNFQALESPSQFIDQIKPENLLQYLSDHLNPLPLTDTTENVTLPSSLPSLPSLPEDNTAGNEESLEKIWKSPLQLSFLVNIEGGEEHFRCSGDDTQVKPHGPQNLKTFVSDKERARTLLHEWIDQYFFLNDECECIETSVTKKDHNDSDHQKDDWDSFIQFCNDRTVGREKALGIPFKDFLEIGSSIECRLCREETIAEIKKIAEIGTSAKTSRVVMKPKILDRPSSQSENEVDFNAAFDYVALEEGNHISNNTNGEQDRYDSVDEEKSDSNLSFLVRDVAIDPKHKRSTNKNNNKKKSSVGNIGATEQHLYLETLTSKQLEEFLSEWLIAGVDEEKLIGMYMHKEIGTSERDADKTSFPVVIIEGELERIKNRVIRTQRSFRESLNSMDIDLEKMRYEWRCKNPEMNLDFSGVNTMENCEESCNKYFTEDILPILTEELSLPSHACAELQIHLWTLYLEVLGKTLNACDAYYKELEEDLADKNNGNLPLFFINASFRALYRRFAEEKIGLLSEIGKQFSKASTSLSMRESHTRLCWEEEFNREEQNERSQKLDEDCRNLVRALTEWTRIVICGRMSAINRERARRLVIVFNMLRVVAGSLGEEYEIVKQHFSQECQNYFAWLLSNIHLAHGVKDRMRLIEMDDVVSLTTGVILMWRHVKIMQSRVGYTLSAEILPLSLHKWVLQSSSIDLGRDEWYQFNPHLVRSRCWPGIGARRKAMGLLAGLTYIWLRERCKEWKAEIASQELLTYFDTVLLPIADQKLVIASKATKKPGDLISKPSKKTKKKKNKKSTSTATNGSSSNPTRNSYEQSEAGKSNDNSSHTPITSMLGGAEDKHILVDKSWEVAKQKSTDDLESKNMKISDTNNASIDSGKKIDSHTIPCGEEEKEAVLITNESVEENTGEFLQLEEKESCNIEICESLVVVQDEFGCIVPAMEFLTDRLIELIVQPENEQILIVSN